MTPELTETLKYLHLGGLLAHWDEYLKLAADKNFSHSRLLTYVLEEECPAQTRKRPPPPAETRPHSRTAAHRDLSLRAPAQAQPEEAHGPL